MKTDPHPLMVCSTELGNDIVFIEFQDNLRVDLAVAQRIVASRLDFTENRKHYVVIDISNVRQVTTEAREFMQRPDAGLKNILGAAFIASNPVSALLANIFVKAPKDFEAKFFSNKKNALEWIYTNRQKPEPVL
ncbi:hypothetical protein WSM22_36760 [Cytophagales bacterium WSM2-2]|nr:hypothetical protein WSM22_36760 [Cytophagales bacterium WSM2-2]